MPANRIFCNIQFLVVLSVVLLSSACGSSSSSDSAPPDTIAPTAPTLVTAVAASDTRVSIRWAASTDSVGVAGYKIYRGGGQIGTATDLLYSDTTCVAATTYAYTVAAYDAAGNSSPLSSSVSTATLAVGTGDTAPPSAPGNVTATASSSSRISLSWNTSADNVGVSGYNIYRAGSASDIPSNVGTSTTTSYADTGLNAATAYYYVVKAFDGVPNESLESNKATATTLQAP